MTARVMTLILRRDMVDGGSACIAGTITELSVVGQYRVRLHDQVSGRKVRETWSAGDGSYEFAWLDTKPKYIIAFDHTSPVQTAAVQDNVVPS